MITIALSILIMFNQKIARPLLFMVLSGHHLELKGWQAVLCICNLCVRNVLSSEKTLPVSEPPRVSHLLPH